MTFTREEAVEALKAITTAVLDTVREAPNGAPEGVMYAAFVARGISLDTFQAIINGMIEFGVIRREGHLIFPTKDQ